MLFYSKRKRNVALTTVAFTVAQIDMDATIDQFTNSVGGSLLRYPLRSATKGKDAKTSNEETHISSATRRLRTAPNLAKSMSELDFSGKEKSAKPPKRISNLIKSTNSSPHTISAGMLTPISENQRNRLNTQLNDDTSMSDASKSSHRKKFSVLSSASYWLSLIKLSESASKHSVSIGFFKLALESGVEPLHRIREELGSYVLKYNLLEELENITKDILNSYNIQDLEKPHIVENDSQLPDDVAVNLGEVHKNTTILQRAVNLKPKFSSINTLVESNKKDVVQKRTPASRKKSPTSRNPKNAVLMNDSVGTSASQQPRKLQMNKGKSYSKCSEKNSNNDEVDDSHNELPKLNDKENMASESIDIYSSK
ncbi:hypothetical protein MA16_Dca022139 [Dendrobium catenatum]|uniref:Uncharacterized protein n=1 Tax=Dendrobium catenatum TaxID=906689 RepID=A0A2I0XG66_9ASPA|nr:hypothetical protein MA16_Dca022139 [Dendrobium catenatum]